MINHHHSNSPEAPGSFETQVAPFDVHRSAKGISRTISFAGWWQMHLNECSRFPEWDAKIVSLPGGCQVSHLSTFLRVLEKKRPICFCFFVGNLTIAVVFSQSHFRPQKIWDCKIDFAFDIPTKQYVFEKNLFSELHSRIDVKSI